MTTLTPAMRRVLGKLSNGDWQCAYELRESIGTLEALRKRQLVESSITLGYMVFPRTNIEWQITEHGKAALQEVTA